MTLNRMVVTDLDGTLAATGGIIREASLASLNLLGAEGVVRVVATGRTLHGARKLLSREFPIEYLIFSSGAGVMNWRTQTLIRQDHLTHDEIARALSVLRDGRIDFMFHHPIPDNHFFSYHVHDLPHADFARRCEKHSAVCFPFAGESAGEGSQLLLIQTAERVGTLMAELQTKLPGFNMIRATSPLDGISIWLELFSDRVSKSLAAAWLAQKLSIASAQVLAVGNDYNDVDLLEWAGMARLMENCPADLRGRFPSVVSNDENGFTEAVQLWLRQ